MTTCSTRTTGTSTTGPRTPARRLHSTRYARKTQRKLQKKIMFTNVFQGRVLDLIKEIAKNKEGIILTQPNEVKIIQ